MMKLMKTWIGVIAVLLVGIKGYGQCAAPAITQQDFCQNQRAEIRITDADPAVTYQWFVKQGDGRFAEVGYGVDGEGRYFVSNNPVSGTSEDFYYVKKTDYNVGPVDRAPTGGSWNNMNAEAYPMTFDATVGFHLDTVTVLVEMTSATEDYMFEIYYKDANGFEYYSERYIAPRSDFELLSGNTYRARFPVANPERLTQGFPIYPGAGQEIQFRSIDDPDNSAFLGVEKIYWWGAGAYTGETSVAGGGLDIDASTGGLGSPLIMDWAITQFCDTTVVTVTESFDCCTPVGDDFTVTSDVFQNLIRSGESATLTASGNDVNGSLYYYWYDASGTEQPGGGQGQNTLTVSNPGVYTVRAVGDPSDINSAACFGNRSISISNTSISTSGDQTICIGDPISIEAFGAEGNYQWTATTFPSLVSFDDETSPTTKVGFLSPGVFEIEVEADVKLGNIVIDGGFENYNPLTNDNIAAYPPVFETVYGNGRLGPGGDKYVWTNGQFRVDNILYAYDQVDFNCKVGSGYFTRENSFGQVVPRGNILYADAVSAGGGALGSKELAMDKPLWQLSNQPIEANTTYEFYMDVSMWNPFNPGEEALFMMLVNGEPLPLTVDGTPTGVTTYAVAGPTCQWHSVYGTWTSGPSETSATITVAEVGLGNYGHEMAIDEITFSTGIGKEKSLLEITVDDCNELEARPNATVCAGDDLDLYLTKNTGFLIDWKDSGNSVIATTEDATIYPSASETYTATVKFPMISYISNGDFENTIDFTTDLNSLGGNVVEQGRYFIGTGNDSRIHNTMTKSQTDHTTGTTSGNMMIMRAQNNQDILEKTISVTAGESYAFSSWMLHLHNGLYGGNAANARAYDFDLIVDGAVVESFNLGLTTIWTNFSHSWTATTTKNVVVQLRFKTNHGETGLAMDDVSIAQLGLQKTVSFDADVSLSLIHI